jgi:hypothetical protein
MKVLPIQNAGVAAATAATTQADSTGGAVFQDTLNDALPAGAKLHDGETLKKVPFHTDFYEIASGDREGMYLNTSGNVRTGQAFVLVRKNGREYHIYGSGKDRLVVGLQPEPSRDDPVGVGKPVKPGSPDRPPGTEDIKLRKGEKIKAVPGHADYAEVVAGPRTGMYVNTSDNYRRGWAFVLVEKDGFDYHIYGSGDDRLVIRVPSSDDDK